MANYYDQQQQQQVYNYAPNPYAGRGGAQWGRGGHNVNPAPELEASRRGRGGRRRGGFPRQQQPPAQLPPPVAPEAPPAGVPQPKHLSKTSSPLTNDPLYLESFMNELGSEMKMAPIANEVHPGHFGFAQIIEEDYKSVTARSHVYAKNVSQSMHSYYVGLHVYARMLDLHRQCGGVLTNNEADFLVQIEVGGYSLTKLIDQYIAGFGNTTIPGSTDCDFIFNKPALQAGENIIGYFGPIVPNAVDYATYVCPGVLAQRIVEDMARTVAHEDIGDDWQLEIDMPEDLEEGPAPPQPNVRCIGWAPRERLRNEMMIALHHSRVTPEAFHSDNPGIPMNTRLMNYVHYQLNEVRGYVEGTMSKSKMGSTAQIVTGVLNENNEVSVRGPFPAAGSIAFFASAFRYRIDVQANPQMIAPYNDAPIIPNLERNRLAENPLLNQHLYQTIYCDSNARLKRIVKFNFASKT